MQSFDTLEVAEHRLGEQRQVAEPPGRATESYTYSAAGKSVLRTVTISDDASHATAIAVPDPSTHDAHSAFDRAFLRGATVGPTIVADLAVRVVDLFSGCGGMSLGAREACTAVGLGFHPLLAIDSDPSILRVYDANFGPSQALDTDIRKLIDGVRGTRRTQSETALLEDLGRVDVLLAGPPCQGYSDLNNHTRRADDRNRLYERVARFIEISLPEHVLVENVPTIVHSVEPSVDDTIALLRELGYYVDTAIVDLSELGVPQERKRHVVAASRSRRMSVERIVSRHHITRSRDIRWAIEDLEGEATTRMLARPTRHSRDNVKRIDYLFDHRLYDLPNRLRPPCHRDGNHSYKSMYGRLQYNEPAQTITSGYGSPGQGRFVHPAQRRALTPHEAARLQFFPDSFDFSCAKRRSDLANMIGNAVPMKLSYVFCLEFLS